MIDAVDARPASVPRAASVLLLAYVCVSAIGWSPLPFNIQWADVLFVAVLAATLFARFGRSKASSERLALAPLDIVVLLFVATSLPSLAAAADRKQAAVGIAKEVYLALVYAVVAAQAPTVAPARVMRWLAFTAAGVVAVCLAALVSFYVLGIGIPRLGVSMPLPYLGRFYRLYGAFASPEYLANFLAFSAPLVWIAWREERGRQVAVLAALTLTACCTAGHGVAGLLAAAAFGVARLWKQRHPVLASAVVATAIAVVVVVNLALIAVVRQVRTTQGRDQQIAAPDSPYTGQGASGASTLDLRVTYNVMGYWRLKEVAWEAFMHHPAAGLGLGSFHVATRRAVEEGRIPAEYREHDPHSTWLGRLAETGIIGTLGLAVLWIGMMMHAARAMRGRDAALAAALTAALIAMAVNSPNVDVMNFRFLWLGFGAVRGLTLRA